MLKGKSLIDYTNLFSPIQYEKKDEIILKSFQLLETKNFVHKQILKGGDKYGWRKDKPRIEIEKYRRIKEINQNVLMSKKFS